MSTLLSRMVSRCGVAFMHLLARLPLKLVRALGWLLGLLLWALVWPRRRVAMRNLALAFPELSAAERAHRVRRNFISFAQTWLDRGWLWHADPATVRQRVRLLGDVEQVGEVEPLVTGLGKELGKDPWKEPGRGLGPAPSALGTERLVIFAPHFYGLDAGWTALTQQVPRPFVTIYTDQANRVVDAWILQGRQRFGQPGVHGRAEGVQPVVSAVKRGGALYLLPDMDFGRDGAEFVPFFGQSTATVTSLSRFARLSRARVVPVTTRLVPTGYEVTVHPAWVDFPSADATADTARMNRELEALIRANPEQYYWVHKRFKTRPEGEASIY